MGAEQPLLAQLKAVEVVVYLLLPVHHTEPPLQELGEVKAPSGWPVGICGRLVVWLQAELQQRGGLSAMVNVLGLVLVAQMRPLEKLLGRATLVPGFLAIQMLRCGMQAIGEMRRRVVK